jgi:aldehyde dehydrogenase (NAD+)
MSSVADDYVRVDEDLMTNSGFIALRSDEQEKEVSAATYDPMMQELRFSFAAGVTKDLEWRRSQLTQLRKLICENHEQLTTAVRADHGGYKLRGLIDFIGVVKEIDLALGKLSSWTRPKRVWHDDGTPLNVFSKSEIRQEPKGVILIIAPWNYPVLLTLTPLVSAIAAGCCCVIKPSEVSENTTNCLAPLITKYFDATTIKVVTGAVAETTALLVHRWDHIFYTGNGAVGRIVMSAAAKHLTPVTLELGGKSPVYVDKSCKLDLAVERISMGKWSNAGQVGVMLTQPTTNESRIHHERITNKSRASFVIHSRRHASRPTT